MLNIVRLSIGGFAHAMPTETLQLQAGDGSWHDLTAHPRYTTDAVHRVVVSHYSVGERRISPSELASTDPSRVRVKPVPVERSLDGDSIGTERAGKLHRIVGTAIREDGLIETHGTYAQKCLGWKIPVPHFEDLTEADFRIVRDCAEGYAVPVRPFAHITEASRLAA